MTVTPVLIRPGTRKRHVLPVPPLVVRWVDRILEDRNVGGMVPFDVYCQILDDMAHVGTVVDSWSCEQMHRYGMHKFCKRPSHEGYEALMAAKRAA